MSNLMYNYIDIEPDKDPKGERENGVSTSAYPRGSTADDTDPQDAAGD
jgi:hypothetical protein